MIHADDRLKTHYEWVAEEITDDEYEDIIDCNYCDTYKDAVKFCEGKKSQIALVISKGSMAEGLQDREYAYLENGRLPECFDGGKKIPKRFHEEIC